MRIEEIIWLDQIIDKLVVKHRVATNEVEEVLSNKPKFRFVEKGESSLLRRDRPGDTANNFNLPGYLQTDLAIFYSQAKFKAAISVQNVFNSGIKDDDEIIPLTILGTAFWEF